MSTVKVANLNIQRSNNAGDARLATVKDRLEEALEDSRDGRWTKCMMIFYCEENERIKLDTRFAGCTKLEARGLMLSEIQTEIVD